MSKNTIINRLNQNAYAYKNPPFKPLLTDEHKKARYEWALEHRDTKWENVAFTDETSLWEGSSGYRRWVNTKDDRDVDTVKKYTYKVHVWGCIWKNQKRIHIFEGNMTGEIYRDILEGNIQDLFLSDEKLILQDDNDSKHRSLIVRQWKADYQIKSLNWPSNSPDLNPIENIWAILKRKVNETCPVSKDEYIKYIEEKWCEITEETIINTIGSMPNRIQMVIENKGDWITY